MSSLVLINILLWHDLTKCYKVHVPLNATIKEVCKLSSVRGRVDYLFFTDRDAGDWRNRRILRKALFGKNWQWMRESQQLKEFI